VAASKLTKSQRRQARAVADAAWQAELSEALREVDRLFAEWRAGAIDAFRLADAIHEFHDGPNRELWKRYSIGLSTEDLAARGIALELVPPAEVPDALREALGEQIERWRELEGEP
jgi:hypothetical protein